MLVFNLIYILSCGNVRKHTPQHSHLIQILLIPLIKPILDVIVNKDELLPAPTLPQFVYY